ncbi:13733_t:CDS:2 [Funneliformis geosporum]|nr:13733_t:CDS:2 [Funneliformis geosporum]
MSCGTFKDYGERWISYIFIDNAIVINMLKDELKRVQIFDLEAKKKNGSAITKTESSSFHSPTCRVLNEKRWPITSIFINNCCQHVSCY